LQVCTVTSRLPHVAQKLDSRPERWGDPGLVEYDCQKCE
jgi:hypothetical protein